MTKLNITFALHPIKERERERDLGATCKLSVPGTKLAVGGKSYEPGSVHFQPKLYQTQSGDLPRPGSGPRSAAWDA